MKHEAQQIKGTLVVEEWSIDEVTPYDKNPRHNDQAAKKVAASLQEYGWRQPIVVDEDGVVIAGHTRLKAAKLLGLETVPVHVARGLTAAQVQAYRLADNRVAEEAEWDDALLALEIKELDGLGFDLALTGFSQDELSEMLDLSADDMDALVDPDAEPDVTDEYYVAQEGDVWVIDADHGQHRLACGDSTSARVIDAVMDGGLVDMVWTDPPYNVDYEGTAGKIQNDKMSDEQFEKFLREAFSQASRVMKDGAAIYVAHADMNGRAGDFILAMKSTGFHIQNCLAWVKPSLVLGRFDYQARHEPILYGWKPGAAHQWHGGRSLTSAFEDKGISGAIDPETGDLVISTPEGTIRISGENLEVHDVEETIIRHEKPRASADHPTMKPIGIIEGHIQNSSRRGEIVLDLFNGSGSTMVAAHMIGRLYRGVELDPRFMDSSLRRMRTVFGLDARRERDGMSFAQLEAEITGKQIQAGDDE